MKEDNSFCTDQEIPTPSVSRTFVRIYRMPKNLTDGYCFGGGVPITFYNVDWFEAVVEDGRDGLTKYIKTKRYYHPWHSFLVLADHPDLTFVMVPA